MLSKEKEMSNFVNDQIIDEIVMDIDDMSDVQVASALSRENLIKVSRYTGAENNGAGPMDWARSVLAEQMFEERLV